MAGQSLESLWIPAAINRRGDQFGIAMGACFSDSLPKVPPVIFPDPPVDGTIVFATRRLGMFGRDFSVHQNAVPSNNKEARDTMWLWINKSNGGELLFLTTIN